MAEDLVERAKTIDELWMKNNGKHFSDSEFLSWVKGIVTKTPFDEEGDMFETYIKDIETAFTVVEELLKEGWKEADVLGFLDYMVEQNISLNISDAILTLSRKWKKEIQSKSV